MITLILDYWTVFSTLIQFSHELAHRSLCFLCVIGYCCTWMKTRNTPLSRSSCYIFTFLYLSFRHLVQIKQIVKVQWISTHQTLLRRKFGVSLEIVAHRIPNTVFIRLTALGAYWIFGPWEWALIRGGRLFNFHNFKKCSMFILQQNNKW